MCENRLSTYSAYSIASFNSSSNEFNGLFLVRFNVRSFIKNFNVSSSFVYMLNIIPDLIILTETKFSEGNTYDIPG